MFEFNLVDNRKTRCSESKDHYFLIFLSSVPGTSGHIRGSVNIHLVDSRWMDGWVKGWMVDGWMMMVMKVGR